MSEYDEVRHAAAIAKHLDRSHGVLRHSADALALIPTLPRKYDEPFWDVVALGADADPLSMFHPETWPSFGNFVEHHHLWAILMFQARVDEERSLQVCMQPQARSPDR